MKEKYNFIFACKVKNFIDKMIHFVELLENLSFRMEKFFGGAFFNVFMKENHLIMKKIILKTLLVSTITLGGGSSIQASKCSIEVVLNDIVDGKTVTLSKEELGNYFTYFPLMQGFFPEGITVQDMLSCPYDRLETVYDRSSEKITAKFLLGDNLIAEDSFDGVSYVDLKQEVDAYKQSPYYNYMLLLTSSPVSAYSINENVTPIVLSPFNFTGTREEAQERLSFLKTRPSRSTILSEIIQLEAYLK